MKIFEKLKLIKTLRPLIYLKKIFRTYLYILALKYQVVEPGKFIAEYNIIYGANIHLFRYISKKTVFRVHTWAFK